MAGTSEELRRCILQGLSSFAVLAGLVVLSTEGGATSALEIDLIGDRVYLEASERVAVETVLSRLGAVTGVAVSVRSSNKVGPLTVEGVPPAEAFAALAEGHDTALRFVDNDGARRLVSIWVSERSASSSPSRQSSPTRVYRSPVPAVVADRQAESAERKRVMALADRGEAGVPGLQRLLSGDNSSQMRELAVRALAQVGGKSAATGLARALFDPDAKVRLQAVDGVRRVKDSRALADLAAAMQRERDPAVRQVMERVLASADR